MTNDQTNDNEIPEPSPEQVSTTPVPDSLRESGPSAPPDESYVPIDGALEVAPVPAPLDPSWRPADYYAAPRSAATFPRWVPLTCGSVAILALVFMVVVGSFLRSGGLARLVAISFGQLNSEAGRMFEDEVDPAARAEFSKSLLAVRDAIADGHLDLSSALPVLQEMQRSTRDGKLSAEEVEDLTASFRKSLSAPKPKAAPGEPPIVDL